MVWADVVVLTRAFVSVGVPTGGFEGIREYHADNLVAVEMF